MRLLVVLFAIAMANTGNAWAEAPLKRLPGKSIRAAIAGKLFTDEVHWAERYKPDGVVEGAGMGRKYSKRWQVRGEELCIADQKQERCYEVWRAGKKLELRLPGGDNFPKSGIIQP